MRGIKSLLKVTTWLDVKKVGRAIFCFLGITVILIEFQRYLYGILIAVLLFRHIVRHKHVSKRVVLYRAPCGRRLRTMNEVYGYLRITKSKLTIDLFCTDSYVHVFSEFLPSKVIDNCC